MIQVFRQPARMLASIGLTLLLLAAVPRAGATDELGMTLAFKDARPVEVVIDARSEQKTWLGVSWYAPGITDAGSQGEHQIFELAPQRDRKTFEVPSRMVGGSLECALWGRKVLRKDCATDCDWCQKNGYHLEQRKAYLFGSLSEGGK
ncbi:MAG: hypothetical protein KDC10_01280 [Calditrichaeota bacterium]|nr:hypothetical protein [Calditrichota bacterium]